MAQPSVRVAVSRRSSHADFRIGPTDALALCGQINGRETSVTVRIALLIWVCILAAWGQSAGALLAARAAEGPGYRTIWIYPNGTAAEIVSVPGLIVPRQSGFWRIGADRIAGRGDERIAPESLNIEYDWFEERLWLEPVNVQHIVKRGPGEVVIREEYVDACSENYQEITFVSPERLAYMDNTAIECGVHPDGNSEWKVIALPDLEGPRISVLDALGETAREPFLQGLTKAALEQGNGQEGLCQGPEEVDFGDWAIVRGQGRWIVRGYVWVGRLCGYFGKFDLPLPAPGKFAKDAELPLPWQTLAAQIPRLQDALVSPQGDFLIALTDKEVLVYSLQGGRLGARLAAQTRIALDIEPLAQVGPPDDSGKIIMAQWATGRHVQRWTRQIQALKAAERRGMAR